MIYFQNTNQNLMLFLNIRKTRCHFGPRLLYFGYSLYHLALDLSLAIQFQNYTRFSLQILADTIPPVLPVLALEYQCHQKITTFQIIFESLQFILDHLLSPPQNIISRRYQSNTLVITFCKIIIDQRAITNQSSLRFILAWGQFS